MFFGPQSPVLSAVEVKGVALVKPAASTVGGTIRPRNDTCLQENPMKKVRTLDLFTINTYWFGLSTMWNSLHVIILPAVLLNFVPETHKNTYLGLLTFVGLIIAMIVQPISGSISDRWQSRWGRRRPLITLGTALDFIFLAILGWAGGLIWLAIGYIGLRPAA